MSTLRTLGAEESARRAAPFLVVGPAAIWQCVSADALFAAVGAWGMAALAIASVRRSTRWALLAGALLGYTAMMSYGLLLLGVLALAILWLGGSWRPLPVAVVVALGIVGLFALLGFNYLDGMSTLHGRYWAGVARNRPEAYWVWGNLAALTYSAGPLLGAALTQLRRGDRIVRVLSLAGVAMVLLADASLMSKAEVERIWLPFVPWLLLSTALLPRRWRQVGLGVQLVSALVIQHLLQTSW